jgi:hypothetical protein
MNLYALYDKLIQFEEAPTQAGISAIRFDITASFSRKEITNEDKDNLLKKLYSVATEAGLFVLQLKNIEIKDEVDIEEDEEDENSYEESYEESYSYEDEEEEEDDNKV